MNWRRVNSSIFARSKANSDMTVNMDNSMGGDDIQARINLIPRYIPQGKTVTIQFANGRYVFNRYLYFKGFYGGGILAIQGNMSEPSSLYTGHGVELDFYAAPATGTNALYFTANQCYVTFDHLMVQAQLVSVNDYMCFVNANAGYFLFRYCRFRGGTGTGYIMVFDHSKGYVFNTYFDSSYACVTASNNAVIYVEGNGSLATSNTYAYISAGATLIGNTSPGPASTNGSAAVNGGQFS